MAQTNPPAKNAQLFIPTKFAFHGQVKVPVWAAMPRINRAIMTLIKDQTIFNSGGETRLNGVIWFCPVIPFTKCGTEFQIKNPAKKYQSNSKILTSFLYFYNGHKYIKLSNQQVTQTHST